MTPDASSTPLEVPPSEDWIASALEEVPVSEVPRQVLVRNDGRRVCLNVVAPPETGRGWSAYQAAATRRARLAGDRLLPLVATGQSDDTFFVAYAIGDTMPLSAHRESVEMTTPHCLELLWGVARALDHAAAAGLYPTEVTPESVFVDRSRGAYLADLGIAREALGSPDKAADVHAPWVAPEVLAGEEAVERSAVYSFGALMYTMLTGASPSDGDRARASRGKPPPLREIRPDLPEALELIVTTAMAREPSRRYRSASEARSLAHIVLQNELQPAAKPPTRGPRFRRGAGQGLRGPGLLAGSDGGAVSERQRHQDEERLAERERKQRIKRERDEARAAKRERDRIEKQQRRADARARRQAEREQKRQADRERKQRLAEQRELERAAEEKRKRELAEQRERERIAAEEQEEKRLAEHRERERVAREEQERARLAEQRERERVARDEQERKRLAEQRERERIAEEEQEEKRLVEQRERERVAAEQEHRRLAAQEESERLAEVEREQELAAQREKERQAEDRRRERAEEEEHEKQLAEQRERERIAKVERKKQLAAHREREAAAKERLAAEQARRLAEAERAKQLALNREKERLANAERQRQLAAQAERERAAKEEQEKQLAAQRERERAAKEEQEKQLAAQRERERVAKEERDKELAAQQERERAAQEKREREIAAQQERERVAKEKREREVAAQRERERVAKEKREREVAAQRERERVAEEKRKRELAAQRERERAAKEKRDAEARAKRAAERQAERERRAQVRAARAEQRRERRAATLQALRERGDQWRARREQSRVAKRERVEEEKPARAERRRRSTTAAGAAGAPPTGAAGAAARSRAKPRPMSEPRRVSESAGGLGQARVLQPGRLRDPHRIARTRRNLARSGPLALIAATVGLGALAGVVLGGPGEAKPPEPQRLSAAGLAVTLPAGWEGTASGQRGLQAHPAGDPRSGLTLEMVSAPVEHGEQANPVRLGRLEAWREPEADVPGARRAVRYVVPTETGKLVITCRASATARPATLAVCEGAASTLRLRAATGLPLAAVIEQQERWQAQVSRLADERAAARRSLAAAPRPSGQRLAAEALARVHERAAARFARLPGGEAVASSSRRTAAAYTALAAAAGTDSSPRWNAARERVRRSEGALRRTIASS